MGPVYLKDLLTYYKPKRDGVRHDLLSLEAPGTKLMTYGNCTFCAVAAIDWNKLLKKICTAKTVDGFKTALKPIFFVTIMTDTVVSTEYREHLLL